MSKLFKVQRPSNGIGRKGGKAFKKTDYFRGDPELLCNDSFSGV